MARHSKIQKQVLSLYKEFLKVTKEQPGFKEYIRNEFRKNAAMPRADSIKIEYLLRRGWRQLEMLKTSSVSGAGVFEKDSPNSSQNDSKESSTVKDKK
ncbi:succinate dehydrogenase assembly factor 1, mitochondrial [Plakobranchus ocellatus]|uniref:Succinate dehydrogenase assembly factor 1, mitochondrial n=1 Tax=Plakobranchus ocellatus TaxID=259542 RepID=A0AAV4AXJ0_9GAST|nr:succinate dehydrogenase assembly factor 1, mitochondrial [Plakobranchus ocellatus]